MTDYRFSEKKLRAQLKQNSTNRYKIGAENYMKNHFKFLGVDASIRSKIIHEATRELNGLSAKEVKSLLASIKSTEREFMSFKIAILAANLHIFNRSKNLKIIKDLLLEDSWWDSVDTISAKVLRPVLLELKPAERKALLVKFSRDKDLWVRRASIVSIVNIRGEIPNSLKKEILTFNLGGGEFFINKAIGWFLREEYFFDQKFVMDFSKKHVLDRVAQREIDRVVKGLSQSGKPMKRAIKQLPRS